MRMGPTSAVSRIAEQIAQGNLPDVVDEIEVCVCHGEECVNQSLIVVLWCVYVCEIFHSGRCFSL